MVTPQSGVMRIHRVDSTKNGPIENYDMLNFDISSLSQQPLNEGDWKAYNELVTGIDNYCDEHEPTVKDIHGIEVLYTQTLAVYHDDNKYFTVSIKDLKA
jgi:hypothetical protein